MKKSVTQVDIPWLAKTTAYANALDITVTNQVASAIFSALADALIQGLDVDLGPKIGRFVVRYREGNLNRESPRTSPAPHYTVVFKASYQLKKQMRGQK